MKQVSIILILSIYLLSLVGNSLYLDYLMEKSETTQNKIIDRGKLERNSLIEMKIPMKAPYYSSSPGYERYYGEVNIDGHFYTYVERKVANDTIYILCLPDHQKTKLQNAKASLLADELGLTNKHENKTPKPFHKKIATDYDEPVNSSSTVLQLRYNRSFSFSYTAMLSCGTERSLIKPPGQFLFS